MEAAPRSQVADHYARGSLVADIRDGLAAMGKTESMVTAEVLSPVDEFHIGGRAATAELAAQLALTAGDRLLDIGCGLGGPARQIAAHYGCQVTGIDLTRDYVEAGNVLSGWLHLKERVSLQQGDALALPFADASFTAAYMLHVGMNIADKSALFSEVARVLRAGARVGVYDVMRTGAGELSYPLPWASTAETNAIAAPGQYRDTLSAAGFGTPATRCCACLFRAAARPGGHWAAGHPDTHGSAAAADGPKHERKYFSRPHCAGRDCCPKAVMPEFDFN
ncbi:MULTISPECIES: methyltransferase domain-containing protein [unclassified Mesorhizobium]|nr:MULTISPECIES: methyltransferase domain-containing protein [unclassified Mesorhizobium]MCT2579689.1 methyltransferase domain-containing protein [Mesorhizobium sp. P13.3]MDF3168954.1 methyltransferase domain-containing protein [Mesorhizobium sp. P16.1]MDF3178498.1 methyltransferase domain-containing protein [Mesorhizobium sp. P17.1]MDF3185867.1 methyltransferase domain-containing protein [Mesorhizobium sp. ICCV3110.1]